MDMRQQLYVINQKIVDGDNLQDIHTECVELQVMVHNLVGSLPDCGLIGLCEQLTLDVAKGEEPKTLIGLIDVINQRLYVHNILTGRLDNLERKQNEY